MKIRKEDRVRVLTGKFRGKEGEVMSVSPKDNKVIVDGINVAKRHQKPTRAMQQGGIIDKAMPIDASNVALIDSDGKAIRYRTLYTEGYADWKFPQPVPPPHTLRDLDASREQPPRPPR